MHEHLRKSLDQSIPEQVRLKDEQKRAIVAEAHRRLENESPSRKPTLKPLIATVAVVGLAVFLGVPYIQNEIGEQAIEELAHADALQKVSIPGENLTTLINAIYVDETKEMIYSDGKRIYAFDTESSTKEILVDGDENISGYEVAANESWIVWKQEDVEGYFVLNRLNGEIRNIPDELHGMRIEGDQLIYTSVSWGDVWLTRLDLTTLEQTRLYDKLQKMYGQYAFGEGKLVLGDPYTENDPNQVPFSVYDLQTNQKIGSFVFPYESVYNLTVSENRVFAELYNEGDEMATLGYVDLTDGKLYTVETPDFVTYAVYRDVLALSTPETSSNTVELFKIKNNKTHALPVLAHIQERLVRPRFTPEGILVVNVENAGFYSMYVVDANKLD
ncbi:hypothetical protein QTL97_06340 [Sporosarcina thermotolerans]|uniref:DUF5050 domain-containing protein n=1 Tax=Sporosarcina thermotolerans TaxID=633404 RepID=A0AAW9ABK5_9BACL|nr:hypothetical protein [Sporosarcina thermotolerans]MDW0116546.1 hypothetical protein [Sporosarcina thermotolerans]WHT48764.1 hypothetical protein QNH10_03170 [Sporosarcina thermotolerans]